MIALTYLILFLIAAAIQLGIITWAVRLGIRGAQPGLMQGVREILAEQHGPQYPAAPVQRPDPRI